MDRCLLATERRSETRLLRSLYRFRYRKFRVSLHFFAVAVRRRSTADCTSGKQVSHPLLPHDSVSQYVHLRIADVVFFVFEAQISSRAGGRPPAESDEKCWKLVLLSMSVQFKNNGTICLLSLQMEQVGKQSSNNIS